MKTGGEEEKVHKKDAPLGLMHTGHSGKMHKVQAFGCRCKVEVHNSAPRLRAAVAGQCTVRYAPREECLERRLLVCIIHQTS